MQINPLSSAAELPQLDLATSADVAPAGAGPSHSSSAINFGDDAGVIDGSAPSTTTDFSPTGSTEGAEGSSPLIAQMMQLLLMMMELIKSMTGDSGDEASAGGEPASQAGAPSGGAGPGGAGGASGAGASGGPGKEMTMENGELQIGKDWGGWDGVSAGELNSSHDVEDRNAMVNVLKENYGMSDGEAEQVTTALHSASKNAGLDATKGVHSDSEAAQIKEQNHANIKDVFANAGPNASSQDFINAIGQVY